MMHRLKLRVDEADGALQRILLVVSRRGFRPHRVTARLEAGRFEVELEVESTRSAATLARQLERLFDVRSVEVLS